VVSKELTKMADTNNTKKKAPSDQPKEGASSKGTQPQQQNAKPQQQFVREKGRGIVKAVLSGDTFVVLHMREQGPPVERQITLSSLQAPQMGRRKTKTQPATADEPFAWASREFLRKKIIGKQVIYTIEFKNPSGREYGVVQLQNQNSGESENIALAVVSNGWAKVKRPTNAPKDGYRPELQELINLEEQAQKALKGLWNSEPDELAKAKRPLDVESNPAVIFEHQKGKAVTGIVEQVRTGSSMRVTLLPSFADVMVFLSGVQAPDQTGDNEFEPFGRESKFFTEHHILNREVQIIFEGVDKFNLYGTVSYLGRNLADELLKNGLGRYVDWSGSRTGNADGLKASEKSAKEKRMRIWSVAEAVKTTQAKPQEGHKSAKVQDEFYAKVVEVLNGSTIVVQDQAGNKHKLNLSSIEVSKLVSPLQKKEDSAPEAKEQQNQVGLPKKQDKQEKKFTKESVERAYAIEAKEFVRKKLIGQKVKCQFDYTLASQGTQEIKGKQQTPEDRHFYSVYLEKNNIAVELTEAGLAKARVHKGGEQRSRDYELILLAEDRARKMSKGLFMAAEKAPVFYVTDLSQLEPSKSRQYLSSLKRHGKLRGVIEFEFSASRVKIYAPKETSYLILSLAAVQAPRKNEPFGEEGLHFLQSIAHQRDCEFEVLSQDKGGSFVGNLWVNKKNVATLLLEQGYAYTHTGVRESEHSSEYQIAEESAKRAKKGVWKNYDEAAEAEQRKKRREENEANRKPKEEFLDVVVTEVIDGCRFYVQQVGDEAEQLDELMKNLSVEVSDEAYSPKVGELVKAQFVDDAWYRARVKGISPQGDFEVFYIDYGNSEAVPANRIRRLEGSFTTLPPQAKEAQLAYVKAPGLDSDYGLEAAELLRDLVYGKEMLANVEYRDAEGRAFLSLGDKDNQVHVNAALLRAGLARVERVRGKSQSQLIAKLKEEEEKARSSHSCIWEYGDPGSDDEDEHKGLKITKPGTKADKKEEKKSSPATTKKE